MVRAMSAARFLCSPSPLPPSRTRRGRHRHRRADGHRHRAQRLLAERRHARTSATYTSGQTDQPRRQRHHQLRQLQRQPDLRARRRRQRQHQRPADEQRRQPAELPALPQRRRAPRSGAPAPTPKACMLIGTQSGSVTVYGRIPREPGRAGRHLHRHRQHHADLLSRRRRCRGSPARALAPGRCSPAAGRAASLSVAPTRVDLGPDDAPAW